MLDIFDGAPATPSLVDAWWKEVVETYECIVEQEPDEDYEEEEEELFEMFEEAMGMGIGLHQNEDEAV